MPEFSLPTGDVPNFCPVWILVRYLYKVPKSIIKYTMQHSIRRFIILKNFPTGPFWFKSYESFVGPRNILVCQNTIFRFDEPAYFT